MWALLYSSLLKVTFCLTSHTSSSPAVPLVQQHRVFVNVFYPIYMYAVLVWKLGQVWNAGVILGNKKSPINHQWAASCHSTLVTEQEKNAVHHIIHLWNQNIEDIQCTFQIGLEKHASQKVCLWPLQVIGAGKYLQPPSCAWCDLHIHKSLLSSNDIT